MLAVPPSPKSHCHEVIVAELELASEKNTVKQLLSGWKPKLAPHCANTLEGSHKPATNSIASIGLNMSGIYLVGFSMVQVEPVRFDACACAHPANGCVAQKSAPPIRQLDKKTIEQGNFPGVGKKRSMLGVCWLWLVGQCSTKTARALSGYNYVKYEGRFPLTASELSTVSP